MMWGKGQKRLGHWNIPPANYSGITPLGNGHYALVSDQERRIGFYVWQISQDPQTGAIIDVQEQGFRGIEWQTDRDAEGIASVPRTGNVWISGEADQRIIEHEVATGKPTRRELAIPHTLGMEAIRPNRGFEALGYDSARDLLWTCTESALRTDPEGEIRLQTFSMDGKPQQQYPYILDAPQASTTGRDHYHGVVALTPLPDGTLLMLEREVLIRSRYIGTRCWCRLFRYTPETGNKVLVQE